MPVVRARLTGRSAAVESLLETIEGMENLKHMEEVADQAPHM